MTAAMQAASAEKNAVLTDTAMKYFVPRGFKREK